MDDFPSLQALFDECLKVPASHHLLYHDMEAVVKDNIGEIRKEGMTDKVWDGYEAVARKYGLTFTHPKYLGGLKTVETRPTLH